MSGCTEWRKAGDVVRAIGKGSWRSRRRGLARVVL